jgi:hypothetical protein
MNMNGRPSPTTIRERAKKPKVESGSRLVSMYIPQLMITAPNAMKYFG